MKTLIFGHQNPDTDTVCASISLANLKSKLKEDVEPRILGDLNKETKYVLDYFDIPVPNLLTDVSAQISSLPYSKEAKINQNASILDAFELMEKLTVTGLPITDDKNNLCGYINLKQISKFLIKEASSKIHTSLVNLARVLNGKIVHEFTNEINGNVRVLLDEKDFFNAKDKLSQEDIVIMGTGNFFINHVPNFKAKVIIIANNAFATTELLEYAKDAHISFIVSKMDLYDTIERIAISNYVGDVCTSNDPKVIHLYDSRKEFIEMANNYGFTNYPVVNNQNKCLGMIKLLDAHRYQKQKVILVDHNQLSQSVYGLDEAEIVEIIDHHNLSIVDTTSPIFCRVMPVGSTCTIIYKMYQENNIDIDPKIAGIMMAAILSDTLILKSPTTTKLDIEVVNDLAKICKEDYKDFGFKMFKAGSSIRGMTPLSIINQDFKSFKYDGGVIGISQVITLNSEDVFRFKDIYIDILNRVSERENYKVFVLSVTDSIKEGTFLFFNDSAKFIISESFNISDIEQGVFIKGILSRKKQIAPAILEFLERKK